MLIAMLVFKIPRVYFTYEVLITRNLETLMRYLCVANFGSRVVLLYAKGI